MIALEGGGGWLPGRHEALDVAIMREVDACKARKRRNAILTPVRSRYARRTGRQGSQESGERALISPEPSRPSAFL